MNILTTRSCAESSYKIATRFYITIHHERITKGMNGVFHTLQDFFSFTEGVIYILIVAILLAMLGFWRFLTGRDEE